MNKVIFDNKTVEQALEAMARTLHADEVYIIGIRQGGARVADTLQQRLESRGCRVQRGNLDISFYRDDLDAIGPNPEVRPSDLPFDVTDKHIWLVDDVLYTGRTIRAALGEIFDYGRPASIRLAVLIDRGGRELPIAADCTGLSCEASANTSVKLLTEGDWHIEQRKVLT
ncbi:MAG: bifunctional pyr operon transcriptional regulator/uracil phosphoribosyltransferase PyrR [Mariprofundaceae bacterium]|nr:bifunctional pyr operon transcriptional regulator/uracil phosphoribosyltransferase PyrR [Mariprofundaceae bacterium]